MISGRILEFRASAYLFDCQQSKKTPTRKGLAKWLQVSYSTVCRVALGRYAVNHPYAEHEGARRLIRNTDFDVVRNVLQEKMPDLKDREK